MVHPTALKTIISMFVLFGLFNYLLKVDLSNNMKRLLLLLLISICILSSCDVNVGDFSLGSNQGQQKFPPENAVGEYYGPTHYYIKDSVIANLSYTGYSIINRKSADLFTISFNTTFRYYTIPDIDFELVPASAGSTKIVLSPGQKYILNSSLGSGFSTQPNGFDYFLSIQSIDPDSTYNLRIHGIKQNN